MDVFYCWRKFDEDMREGRIGWLVSDRKKMNDLRESYPDFIWAFRTPAGRKGELQLVARVKWVDKPTVAIPRNDSRSEIYYDPAHPDSRRYIDVDADAHIKEVSSMIRREFPNAFIANFHGDNGLQPMRGDFLRKFRTIADGYPSRQFVEALTREGLDA